MSHLGNRLSALVDGELGGAERDRAYAHLAGCEECLAEAAELRELKRQLRSLDVEAPAEAELTQRLMAAVAAAAPANPANPANLVRQRRRRVVPRPPRALRGPGGSSAPRRMSKRNRRYLMLGTMSIVVGLGTAAFSVGGSEPAPGPKITPQFELYSEEHAITTGEVPFAGPTAGSVEGNGVPSVPLPAPTVTALDSDGPAQNP
jgi:hypothetical protein